MELSTSEDITFCLRVAREELPVQTEFPHQLPDRSRKARALRAQLKEIAVSPGCGDDASRTGVRFEDQAGDAKLLQAKSTSQAGDASADDGDFLCVSHRKQNLS